MTPERMQRIQDLYARTSECGERDRPSFLQRACAGDEALRQEVESLLNQEQRIGGFLEQTALHDAALDMIRRDESLVGRRLGHYEILAFIGRGGMGEVYKAKDTRLERTVAIKTLPQDFLSSPQAKQRFHREAQTIANLNHPNICVLYDVGEIDGIDFLVMEYLEGVTLAERLKKRALPLAECVNIAMQIGDALEKAHRSGVVHRDLKPANIMLTPEGAKLLDFGVARLMREIAGAVEPTSLTGANVIVGTLQYMSPEQIDGVKADTRSDIFAFGTVLYEMMTGHKAFEGDSNATLISSIVTKTPPPPSKVIPAFPALVDRVVSRCLAKDPAQRWHSARDASIELKWAVEAAHESPALTRRAGWLTWATGLAVLIAAVIGIGSLYDRATMTAPEMRVEITTPPTTESQSFAISPDGRKIVFVANTQDGPALWLRLLNSSVARPLRGAEGATYPFWSP
ncbi:MAG TPA: protein kinase, partial [Anaerolineae bacterium]